MAITDVLLYGDTERYAALRHELPIAIMDPFLLAVIDGRIHVMASTLEPGLWKEGLGQVRFEDLLLVTDDGSTTLTEYPYDLAP